MTNNMPVKTMNIVHRTKYSLHQHTYGYTMYYDTLYAHRTQPVEAIAVR